MDKFSTRYMEWFGTSLNSASSQPVTTEPAPRPRYIVWVGGGRATIDGFNKMLGEANLHFLSDDELSYLSEWVTSSFDIVVESPEEGVKLIRRIMCCVAIGMVELEEDGEYHEWYSDDGESASEIADAQDEEAEKVEVSPIVGLLDTNPQFERFVRGYVKSHSR